MPRSSTSTSATPLRNRGRRVSRSGVLISIGVRTAESCLRCRRAAKELIAFLIPQIDCSITSRPLACAFRRRITSVRVKIRKLIFVEQQLDNLAGLRDVGERFVPDDNVLDLPDW